MIKTAAPTATQAFVCDIHTLPAMYRSRRYSFGLNIAMTSFGNGTKNPNCNYRYFEFYALSHMYHGRGYYQTPNAPKRELRPGEGILIAPGFVHYYGGSNSEPYYEDTICFFGSSADYLFEQGLLRSGILPLGETRHLQPIIKLAQSTSVDDYLSACVRLQELLLQFHRRNSENPSNDRPETERLQELLREIDSTPQQWWSLQEMATFVHIPITRLRALFRETTGLLPKQYIDHRKIRLAQQMLQASDLKLEQIARQLGYQDTCHFSRRFKQLSGIAPEFYRQQQRKRA